MYNNSVNDDNLTVSWILGNNVLTKEKPHVRITRSERRICDTCMKFRQKTRMVQEETVQDVAAAWRQNLYYAANSREEHNSFRAEARCV